MSDTKRTVLLVEDPQLQWNILTKIYQTVRDRFRSDPDVAIIVNAPTWEQLSKEEQALFLDTVSACMAAKESLSAQAGNASLHSCLQLIQNECTGFIEGWGFIRFNSSPDVYDGHTNIDGCKVVQCFANTVIDDEKGLFADIFDAQLAYLYDRDFCIAPIHTDSKYEELLIDKGLSYSRIFFWGNSIPEGPFNMTEQPVRFDVNIDKLDREGIDQRLRFEFVHSMEDLGHCLN